MNVKKTLFILGLIVLMAALSPVSSSFGIEPPPGADWKIVGPTMWAVGIIDCTDMSPGAYVALRVKMVDSVSCNVSTKVVLDTANYNACPDVNNYQSLIIYQQLESPIFPEQPCTPIVTKVKNFTENGANLRSFDAQIQYIVDKDYAYTECQLPPSQ